MYTKKSKKQYGGLKQEYIESETDQLNQNYDYYRNNYLNQPASPDKRTLNM